MSFPSLRTLCTFAAGIVILAACSESETPDSLGPLAPEFTILDVGPGNRLAEINRLEVCKDGSKAVVRLSSNTGSPSGDFSLNDGDCREYIDDKASSSGTVATVEEIAAEAGYHFASLVVTEVRGTVIDHVCKRDQVTYTTTNVGNPQYTVVFDGCNGFLFEYTNEMKFEGCTPGAWKNRLLDAGQWLPTGLSPDQTVGSLFANAPAALAGATLLEALEFDGGDEYVDKVALLIHHATAAALNAGHPDVLYPFTQAEVIAATNAAIASGDADPVEDLKDVYDDANNAGCLGDD